MPWSSVCSSCAALLLSLSALCAPSAAQAPDGLETSPFGFSCDNQTTYTLDRYCARMAEAGITWIRGFPTANVVEPERGKPDWSTVDKMLATAAANRMAVSGLLFYMPSWIEAGEAKLPVSDLPGWSDYVSKLVAHCKGTVRYWEVWNETPNFIGTATAADYAQTVVSAYDAAKAADPTCQIGLSIQSNNVYWIEQVIQAGAKEHYDFIAVHPYETLGLVESDGLEAEFLSIVPTLRKMLAAQDPARSEAPIWFTEVGYDAKEGEVPQASALVKAFTLSLAQGVTRIDWFEGMDGDSGPMGLLRADGTPRLAYTAMAYLTRHLGATPRYEGWVLLGGNDYGFVFEGAASTVMALWARPGTVDEVSLGATVRIVDPLTGATVEGDSYSLSSVPVLVLDVPPAMLENAQANKGLPVPGRDGCDYSAATSVWATMGSPNVERGLHHVSADAGSTPAVAYGVPARDCGKGAGQSFTVDPGFLSYTAEPIVVTVVVRRNEANDNAGFNLWYESATGWRNTGGWYTIPGNDQWYTQSWTLPDPQFVGKWGYHFALNSDSPMSYYLRSITVSKVVPPAAPPR
jgi:polysaccharide biosynthesis protein PslG